MIQQLDKVKSCSAYFNEIYVKKHMIDLYNDIISYNTKYNFVDISFKTKVYNYENKIVIQPTCRCCDNIVLLNKDYKKGYLPYCSKVCSHKGKKKEVVEIIQTDEYIISHIQENPTRLREKYIIDNFKYFHIKIEQFIVDNYILINTNKDTFIQKLYYYINNIKQTITCKSCDNITSFGDSLKIGYRPYCSTICREKNTETQLKRKETNKERYGVDNVAKNENIKEKIKETNLEKYGTKSTFQNVEVREKWKKGIQEKYNVDHIFQIEDVKKMIRDTFNEKYGTWFTKTQQYLEKTQQTNVEKYGVNWYTQTEEYREKANKTNVEKYSKPYYTQTNEYKIKVNISNLEKYGVEWFYQSGIFKTKSIETYKERYGVEHYTKTVDYLDKAKTANLEKYGVEWFYQSDIFKEKSKKTNNEKYNVDYYSQTDIFKNNIKQYNNIKFNDYYVNKFKDIDLEFVEFSNPILTLTNNKCNHLFKINKHTFRNRLVDSTTICTICNPLYEGVSDAEKEIVDFLMEQNIKVETTNKTILGNNKHLDIYLPEYNLAIEYNGVYWHSELYKERTYHIEKTNICNLRGVELFHIWEDNWLYNKDVVKSVLLNKIYKTPNRIYARKTIIKILDFHVAQTFFDNNHILKSSIGNINIGLIYNDDIVSVMSFTNSNKDKKEYNLIRFASVKNTTVVGGAEKLFKYFLNNYEYNYIISFADVSQFGGKLYIKIGFDFLYRTKPDYSWVVNNIRVHKFNFRKKRLVKMGADSKKSEYDIMTEMGYFRIWNCGLDKYIYTNPDIKKSDSV